MMARCADESTAESCRSASDANLTSVSSSSSMRSTPSTRSSCSSSQPKSEILIDEGREGRPLLCI